jgi:hypothetical protein
MPLTDNCDLYGAVHEGGINTVAMHIMKQRPSLFNYGTELIEAKPELLCEPINPSPAVIQYGNPLITIEDPLPVLGTNGTIALNFCFQLTRLEIDFHPGHIALPAELSPPLAPQHFAIHARVCGGIGCPPRDIIEKLPIPPPPPPKKEQGPPPPPPTVVPPRRLECFCLDLFIVGHVEVTGTVGSQQLLGKVDGLEIVDITPKGLENSLECYLNLLLQLVILPRTSIAIEKLVFDILNLATVTLSPTPVSAAVPNNPAIEKDQFKLFIDVGVTP